MAAFVITALEELDHRADAGLHFHQRRLEPRSGQQRKQRRLMRDQAAKGVRAPRRGAQDDRGAERVAGDVRRGEIELLDQRGKVVGVVEHAALRRRSLARAVTAAIVDEHAEGVRQRCNDAVPAVMVTPGTMHQHERLFGLVP